MQDAAKQAIEVLENDIPEWSNDLYNDIRAYAIEQGMDEATGEHHCRSDCDQDFAQSEIV